MKKNTKYLKQAMEETYMLVTTNSMKWPDNFTVEKKLVLLKGSLEFWQTEEEYEKCAILKKIIDNIENKT